jgi:hypothetical protein
MSVSAKIDRRAAVGTMAAAYGECATGYVPTQRGVDEADTNLRDCCWVAPGAGRAMTEAIHKVLLTHVKAGFQTL